MAPVGPVVAQQVRAVLHLRLAEMARPQVPVVVVVAEFQQVRLPQQRMAARVLPEQI